MGFGLNSITLAMLIHAGSKRRGSSDPPERYRTQDVMYAFTELMVRRRTRVAGECQLCFSSSLYWVGSTLRCVIQKPGKPISRVHNIDIVL